MKRIGNFLFVEQWFIDCEPRPMIININLIGVIHAQTCEGRERTAIDLSTNDRIYLTGEHDDNIIELSELLNI